MTDNILALDINGVKVIRDSTTKLINLSGVASVGYKTFHNKEDDSNYQVPVGKKCTVIYLNQWHCTDTACTLVYADNLDGSTNAVTLFAPNSLADESNTLLISAEVPAGKYITQYAPAIWTLAPKIIGIEETA
jgi:hypothetical protein